MAILANVGVVVVGLDPPDHPTPDRPAPDRQDQFSFFFVFWPSFLNPQSPNPKPKDLHSDLDPKPLTLNPWKGDQTLRGATLQGPTMTHTRSKIGLAKIGLAKMSKTGVSHDNPRTPNVYIRGSRPSKTRMLDFGQFDFGQLAEIELAEVEICRSRSWPKSKLAEVERVCSVSSFFLFFLVFSSLSFSLSSFFLFLFFVSFSSFSSYSSFVFVLFLFLSPKTFALNPKTPNPKPSAGTPSAGPPKFSLFFSLSRHSFHSFLPLLGVSHDSPRAQREKEKKSANFWAPHPSGPQRIVKPLKH